MSRVLERIPWFVLAPAVVVAAAVLAVAGNYLAGPLFERVYLDEADPLAVQGQGQDQALPTSGTADGPAEPVSMDPGKAEAPAVIARGQFRDGDPGHHGKGMVKLIRGADGMLTLRFEDFSVTNGPDLYVILSSDPRGGRSSADDGLNLGRNRATDGNINYAIPAGTDLSAYQSVIIWCRQFNVVFAVATLEAGA